ncbi:MAG: MBL fold metallo-hydrolase [Nitrospirota bacterium]
MLKLKSLTVLVLQPSAQGDIFIGEDFAMDIRFHGAVRAVTGSCFHIEHNNINLLIDCGMFQGKDSEERNRSPFPFNPRDIDILILTHAHIDHIGLVPRLVKEGFKGKIITTPATADLAEIMLLDSAHIQEKDAEWLSRKEMRAGRKPVSPLYSAEDVEDCLLFFDGRQYDSIETIEDGIDFRFRDAGHILGSAIVELWFKDRGGKRKCVFSGDIGRKGNPIVRDPSIIEETDVVVTESTYGNRLHKSLHETVEELFGIISTTFNRGGNVLIPSFALGRTQDILYILNGFVREGRFRELDVYLDSPLAEEATEIYLSHPECFDEEAFSLLTKGSLGGDAMRIHFTKDVTESQAINRIDSGAIIIAGSGMCEGGRIRHHLKHNLWRKECSIVFVGFQASGTLGRTIVDGAERVHIFGEDIAIKSGIHTLGGFSAHADRDELLGWIGNFKNTPEVIVVHGEESVSLNFAGFIKERFGFKTSVPEIHQEFRI